MLTTKELIQQVRDDVMEWDKNVLPDTTICSRLHRGYIEVIKTLNKTHSSFFKEWKEITVPTEGYNLFNFLGRNVDTVTYGNVALKRVEPYERQKAERLGGSPFLYTVEAGKLYILPTASVTVKVLIAPRVLPLSPALGRITRASGTQLTLDAYLSADEMLFFETTPNPIVTVCDWETGVPKRAYKVGLVEGNIINCIESSIIEYLGFPITSVTPSDDLSADIELREGDVVSFGLSSGVPLIPDDLTHYMVAWATLATRGAYGETDDVLREMMTQLTKDIHSEAANIPQFGKIRKEFGKVNSYAVYRRT